MSSARNGHELRLVLRCPVSDNHMGAIHFPPGTEPLDLPPGLMLSAQCRHSPECKREGYRVYHTLELRTGKVDTIYRPYSQPRQVREFLQAVASHKE